MIYFTVIFAFIISLLCFWASIRLIRTYFKVKSWSRVEANVLSKKIEMRKKRSNSGTAIYIPVLEYSYVMNGITYHGSKVYLEELLEGARSARQHQVEAKLNTIGQKAMIYVNPNSPDESVFYCDGIGIYFFLIFLGFLSFFIGLVYLIDIII